MLTIFVILICLAFGWQSYRHPAIGLGAIGLAFAIQCLYGNDQPGVLVAGINLYAGDLASLVVFAAAILRLVARPRRSWGPFVIIVLMLGFVLLQSLFRGLAVYGLKPAGLAFRGDFPLFASLLFGVTYLDLQSFQRSIIIFFDIIFVFLIILIISRWFMVVAGFNVNPHWDTSTDASTRIPIRVVAAAAAFLLGQISLLWLAWRRHPTFVPWVGIFIVFLLQHRSVWLAILVGGTYLAYKEYRIQGGYGISKRVVVVFVLTMMVMALFIAKIPSVRAALEASATNESTWKWRVASWAAALAPGQMNGWVWLIGKPYGTPTTRFMLGQVVDVAFHSHYVTVLVQTGFLGLFVWLILWIMGLKKYHGFPFQRVIVLSQMVYGIAYSVQNHQGLLLALAICPWLLCDRTPEDLGTLQLNSK